MADQQFPAVQKTMTQGELVAVSAVGLGMGWVAAKIVERYPVPSIALAYLLGYAVRKATS